MSACVTLETMPAGVLLFMQRIRAADGNLTDGPSRREVRALLESLAWTRRLRRE